MRVMGRDDSAGFPTVVCRSPACTVCRGVALLNGVTGGYFVVERGLSVSFVLPPKIDVFVGFVDGEFMLK